jgi:hypothetical protein
MALPLNVFKTVTKVATVAPVGIYTAPVGYSAVVLLSQVTNIGNHTQTVSFSHQRTTAGIAVTTEILKDFPVSSSDTANLLAGKLVLESGDSIVLSSSSETDIKFIGSILETLS